MKKGVAIMMWIDVVLLAAFRVTSMQSALNDVHHVATVGQRTSNTAQFIYAPLCIIMAIGLAFRQHWIRLLLPIWLPAIIVAASLAPIVWGDAPLSVGVLAGLSAGAVAALLAWLMIYVLRHSKQ